MAASLMNWVPVISIPNLAVINSLSAARNSTRCLDLEHEAEEVTETEQDSSSDKFVSFSMKKKKQKKKLKNKLMSA